MAFSKKFHLQQNIYALRTAFKLDKEKRTPTSGERLLMMQYSGFGGLKFVLNPVADEIDINNWRKTDHQFFEATQELHQLLRENSADEKEYRRYVDSMRNSVLTAFYTPAPLIKALADVMKENGITVNKMLEPSAGAGAFIERFKESFGTIRDISAYEKDLLTGKILKHIYPDVNAHVRGFEDIPEADKESYDLVTSNIPFGTASVFDLSYTRGNDPAKALAAKAIHNYFFLKGSDMLRDGGILAFITSQGVLDSPANQPIREALMKENNLVSVVRLPNNLFTEHAGTEVGSDLVILQKNKNKKELTENEKDFCLSIDAKDDRKINAWVMYSACTVFDEIIESTDQYGRKQPIFLHSGGVELLHLLGHKF